MDDLGSSYFSIVEAAAQIRAGKLSSFDLVRNALDRISTLDTDNKVFIQTIQKEKPNGIKGDFILSSFITSTMGVSYKLKLRE